MRTLIGVAVHSPVQVYEWLVSKKIDTKVMMLNEKMDKPTSKEVVLLCPTVTLFIANREVLNKCKRASVIVFDTGIKLEYLKPIEILDVAQKKSSYLYTFKPLTASMVLKAIKTPTDVEVAEKTVRIIPKLLRHSNASFISMIMNFIYRIPNSESREEVKNMIFSYLSDNQTEVLADKLDKKYKRNELVKSFIILLREGKANNFAAALKDITEHMKVKRTTKKADIEAKTKAINYKRVSKQYDVSPFDLQYSAKYLARILEAQDKKAA
jgi:hypothetical protein